MSTVALPRPALAGLQALHAAKEQAAREIAAAVQRVLPAGFRGRITLVIDGGIIHAHDVAIELRPIQPCK